MRSRAIRGTGTCTLSSGTMLTFCTETSVVFERLRHWPRLKLQRNAIGKAERLLADQGSPVLTNPSRRGESPADSDRGQCPVSSASASRSTPARHWAERGATPAERQRRRPSGRPCRRRRSAPDERRQNRRAGGCPPA